MFYTYVLKSEKDGKPYVGHTENIEKRLARHNAGFVSSTKRRVPFVLIYKRGFSSRNEARWQERKWKTAWGRQELVRLLSLIPLSEPISDPIGS